MFLKWIPRRGLLEAQEKAIGFGRSYLEYGEAECGRMLMRHEFVLFIVLIRHQD